MGKMVIMIWVWTRVCLHWTPYIPCVSSVSAKWRWIMRKQTGQKLWILHSLQSPPRSKHAWCLRLDICYLYPIIYCSVSFSATHTTQFGVFNIWYGKICLKGLEPKIGGEADSTIGHALMASLTWSKDQCIVRHEKHSWNCHKFDRNVVPGLLAFCRDFSASLVPATAHFLYCQAFSQCVKNK